MRTLQLRDGKKIAPQKAHALQSSGCSVSLVREVWRKSVKMRRIKMQERVLLVGKLCSAHCHKNAICSIFFLMGCLLFLSNKQH